MKNRFPIARNSIQTIRRKKKEKKKEKSFDQPTRGINYWPIKLGKWNRLWNLGALNSCPRPRIVSSMKMEKSLG